MNYKTFYLSKYQEKGNGPSNELPKGILMFPTKALTSEIK